MKPAPTRGRAPPASTEHASSTERPSDHAEPRAPPGGASALPPAPLPELGQGLASAEAERRLDTYGPNATPEERGRWWAALLGKLWAPVPWMLEVTIVLELLLGRDGEAAIIAALLVLNAVLAFAQESRARTALDLLRQRLAVQARTLRDGKWGLLAAARLVPGDIVHLRAGDLVPADALLGEGNLSLDQSTLTGESLPVEAAPRATAFAGSTVKRGEATCWVTATGARTAFGKTAELVRLARTQSRLETVIFTIVKYLVALDAVLVAAVLVYAAVTGIPARDVLPFSLILLVASVPVALPATFTVATALGSRELAERGVLTTRLSAIEEAGGMDLLLSDKTGTITRNALVVAHLWAAPPHTEDDVLRFAAIASDESTQDPIDLAILAAARERRAGPERPGHVRFEPFDPATKRSEGWVDLGGERLHSAKGAPQVVLPLARAETAELRRTVEEMEAGGLRVLAVAASRSDAALELVGLIGLHDPPRDDSARLVQALGELGVRVMMVTGDSAATAVAIAREVGIGTRVARAADLRGGSADDYLRHDVFARVLPEDKFHLVRASQQAGHITGMTGDGVNDAPALRQAEVGIAVSSAVDVAKAAASVVLTQPGLGNVVSAIETSRRIYQRMLTYTLNKIVKTCEIAVLLGLGLVLGGVFVTTPTLIVLLLFTNDFVTMSIATDHVTAARTPSRWRIRPLVLTALSLALPMLCLSFAFFVGAYDYLGMPLPQVQTLVFVLLVFGGQGTVYVVRERRHFWKSRPSRALLVSSAADVVAVSVLATQGILMAPLGLGWIAATLGIVAAYLAVLDFLKVALVRRLQY